MPYHNYTIQQVSETCWNWCQKQYEINQSNIQIENLGVVGVALISLLINHLIYNHSDFIIKHTKITEKKLEILFMATSYFAFVLLILFLGYFIFF